MLCDISENLILTFQHDYGNTIINKMNFYNTLSHESQYQNF